MTDNENLLVALSEFISDRKEGISSGAYQLEIADLEEGNIFDINSFGISVSGEGKFKINIDLLRRRR